MGEAKKKKRKENQQKKLAQEEYCERRCVVSTRAKLKTNMRYATKGSVVVGGGMGWGGCG